MTEIAGFVIYTGKQRIISWSNTWSAQFTTLSAKKYPFNVFAGAVLIYKLCL